jgi:hypothetical protein
MENSKFCSVNLIMEKIYLSKTDYSEFWNWTLGWSEIEICKNQKELQSEKLRTLITNNFCSTTFQILSADVRASAQKVEKRPEKLKFFSILEIYSKIEVQKFNVCASFTRLTKPALKNPCRRFYVYGT